MLISLALTIAALELLVSLVIAEPVYEELLVQRMKWYLLNGYEVDRNIF